MLVLPRTKGRTCSWHIWCCNEEPFAAIAGSGGERPSPAEILNTLRLGVGLVTTYAVLLGWMMLRNLRLAGRPSRSFGTSRPRISPEFAGVGAC